jgi:bleomycin hydrolase
MTQYTRELDVNNIRLIISKYQTNPEYMVTANAYQTSSFNVLTHDQNIINDTNHIFSNVIPNDSKIEPINQHSAGVCWMCAGMSIHKRHIVKKLRLNNKFNLSINHLLFWHKLEVCNTSMNFIIESKNLKPATPKVKSILNGPCSDGGYWHTFANLVKKYGLVPDSVFKSRYISKNTATLNTLLKYKIREFASIVMSTNNSTRNVSDGDIITRTDEDLHKIKGKFLETITKIIIRLLGTPFYPNSTFNWTYVDTDNKKCISRNLTPLTFYETYYGEKYDNYMTVINDPRDRHPYYKLYTRRMREMTIDDRSHDDSHKMLNLPDDEIIQLIVRQIDDNVPVWFACDVGKYVDHKNNIMDVNVFNYDQPLGTSFTKMSKADRLDFCDSTASHAMAIVGYDTHDTHKSKKRKMDSSSSTNPKKSKYSNIDEEKDKLDDKDFDKSKTRKYKKNTSDEKKANSDDSYEPNNRVIKFKVENSWGNVGDNDGYYSMSVEWFKLFAYEFAIDKKYLNAEYSDILHTIPSVFVTDDPFEKIINQTDQVLTCGCVFN